MADSLKSFLNTLLNLDSRLAQFFSLLDEFIHKPFKLDKTVSIGKGLQEILIHNGYLTEVVMRTLDDYISISSVFSDIKEETRQNLMSTVLRIQTYDLYLFLNQVYRWKEKRYVTYSRAYGTNQTILQRLFYKNMFSHLFEILASKNQKTLLFVATTDFGTLGILFGLFQQTSSMYFAGIKGYEEANWKNFFEVIGCVGEWQSLQKIFMELPDLLVMFLSGITIEKIVSKFILSARKDLGFEKDVKAFETHRSFNDFKKLGKKIRNFLKNSVELNKMKVSINVEFSFKHPLDSVIIFPTGNSCLLSAKNLSDVIYSYILTHQMMLLISFALQVQIKFNELYCIGLFHESLVFYYPGKNVSLIKKQFFHSSSNRLDKCIVHDIFDIEAKNLGCSALTSLRIISK